MLEARRRGLLRRGRDSDSFDDHHRHRHRADAARHRGRAPATCDTDGRVDVPGETPRDWSPRRQSPARDGCRRRRTVAPGFTHSARDHLGARRSRRRAGRPGARARSAPDHCALCPIVHRHVDAAARRAASRAAGRRCCCVRARRRDVPASGTSVVAQAARGCRAACRRHEPGRPAARRPAFDRMEPVDVLVGRHRFEHRAARRPAARPGAAPACRATSRIVADSAPRARPRRAVSVPAAQRDAPHLDADLGARLGLAPEIDLRRGILAHRHQRERRVHAPAARSARPRARAGARTAAAGSSPRAGCAPPARPRRRRDGISSRWIDARPPVGGIDAHQHARSGARSPLAGVEALRHAA